MKLLKRLFVFVTIDKGGTEEGILCYPLKRESGDIELKPMITNDLETLKQFRIVAEDMKKLGGIKYVIRKFKSTREIT